MQLEVQQITSSCMYFSCIVYFEDEKVVELNRGNDNCNTRFENSKVCLENYVKPQEGIFSCIAKIDSFNRRLEGKLNMTNE